MSFLIAALVAGPATYRFLPEPGKSYAIDLKVYWEAKHSTSTLKMVMQARRTGDGLYTMDLDLVGAVVDGKDMSALLRSSLKSPRVSMGWNDLAQRAGSMTQLQIKHMPPALAPIIGEAGVYLCEFARKPIAPGATYTASTTASGGCTTGAYTFKGVDDKSGKKLATYTVDKIALFAGKQTQTMVFTVDAKTGVPLSMTYQINDPAKGGKVSFRQTITQM
ncbi:MAG: hypothetical protein JSS65_01285 [Armatimonadetes bacterium]|nr:hypothetical protein [Armatimonadota bacterium]